MEQIKAYTLKRPPELAFSVRKLRSGRFVPYAVLQRSDDMVQACWFFPPDGYDLDYEAVQEWSEGQDVYVTEWLNQAIGWSGPEEHKASWWWKIKRRLRGFIKRSS